MQFLNNINDMTLEKHQLLNYSTEYTKYIYNRINIAPPKLFFIFKIASYISNTLVALFQW